MLREVRHPHVGLRIIPFSFTLSAGTPTLVAGLGSLAMTDGGVGVYTLTANRAFMARPGVLITRNQSSLGAAEGMARFDVRGSNSTNAAFRLNALNDDAGAAEDCGINGLIIGTDAQSNQSEDIVPYQKVKCEWDRAVIIGGSVQGSIPQVDIGKKDFSVTKNGTGDYTVTFLRPFGSNPIITVNSWTACSCKILRDTAGDLSPTQCRLLFTNIDSGAAEDAIFNIMVLGTLSTMPQHNVRSVLQNTQRKPRLLYFEVNPSAGTSTISIGGKDATLTDNGAGDFTLTFTTPFARQPVAVAQGMLADTTDNDAIIISQTASAIRIKCCNISGGAGLDGEKVGVLVLGSDDATEY